MNSITDGIILLVVFILSATVHEVSHGVAALIFGDTTARDAHRLTLNPLAHIDGMGSVVIPAFLALAGAPIIAFAKPVPYNPYRLRHPRIQEPLIAFAGPLSNFVLAGAAALVARVLLSSWGISTLRLPYEVYEVALPICMTIVLVNVGLGCFNLLPIPPLDGSKVIQLFMFGRLLQWWRALQGSPQMQFGLIIALFITAYVLPGGSLMAIERPIIRWFMGV